MRRLISYKIFYLINCTAAIKLLLRRTLVLEQVYSAIFSQRDRRVRCVKYFMFLGALVSPWFDSFSQRQDINLNNDWQTSLKGTNEWKKVNIPHNWDDYYGYRRLQHGNLHGDVVYKKSFTTKQAKQGKRFFFIL